MKFHWKSRLYDADETAGGAAPAAPWAADAAAYFGDNAEAIAGFDRYMREKNQPYITQLEESVAPARDLYTRLNDEEKVADTVREIIESVYADAPDVISAYDAIFNPPQEVVEPPAVDAPPSALSDEDRALIDWARNKRDAELVDTRNQEYADFKDELVAKHKLDDDDKGLLDPFIATAADGDAAVAAYKAWKSKFAPPAAEETVPTPPAVVDGTTVPPTKTPFTRYDQIGDALKAHLAQQAASSTPPPVVG